MSTMKSGITYKQGEVAIVPFPFSDLSAVKRRPVIVLSNDAYNSQSEDLVVCAVTSNPKNAAYSVSFGNEDLVRGSLPHASRIKVDKLFTVKKSKVVKSVALVSDEILNKTKDEMLKLFAF